MSSSERVKDNLRSAVDTMKRACAEAERAIATDSDADAVQRVFHALAWGFANASSGVETAMAALEDAHCIRAIKAADRIEQLEKPVEKDTGSGNAV